MPNGFRLRRRSRNAYAAAWGVTVNGRTVTYGFCRTVEIAQRIAEYEATLRKTVRYEVCAYVMPLTAQEIQL